MLLCPWHTACVLSVAHCAASFRLQGFFFTDTKDLGYGLVQMEGGPCGVLAAVNVREMW